MILTIRTDKPESELGLYDEHTKKTYEIWQAHRELAETIHVKLDEVLRSSDISLQDVTGIVIFKGPGSFTGLRIGMSVANALAYGLKVPIVSTENDDWIKIGIERLLNGENEIVAVPEYGAPANITQPKH